MKKWSGGEIVLTIILLICGVLPGVVCALIILKNHGDVAPQWSIGEYALTILLYIFGIIPGIICMLIIMNKHGELKKVVESVQKE